MTVLHLRECVFCTSAVKTDSRDTQVQFEVDNLRQGAKLDLIQNALYPSCDNLDRLGAKLEMAATDVQAYMKPLVQATG